MFHDSAYSLPALCHEVLEQHRIIHGGEQERRFTAKWEIHFHEKVQQNTMEAPRISPHPPFMLQAGGSEDQGMLGLKTSHQILAQISSMFFLCYAQMFDGKQTAPAEKPMLKKPPAYFLWEREKKKRTQSAISSTIIKGRNPNPICCHLLNDLHHMYTMSLQRREEKRNPRKRKLGSPEEAPG